MILLGPSQLAVEIVAEKKFEGSSDNSYKHDEALERIGIFL